MLARVLSAVIAAAILIVILFTNVTVIGVCAVILSIWCLLEAYSVFSFHKNPALLAIGILCCLAAPFLECWSFPQIIGFLFLGVMFLAAVMVIMPKKISIVELSVMCFLSILIPVSFSLLVWIRKIPTFGVFYLWLPFIGAFCSDMGAFFVGRALKGPKLCELLSPKKTISGSVGGLLGSVVGFFVFSMILRFGFDIRVAPVAYYILAVLCSVAGQLGDLTASAIKRYANVKDFGNIMPGHGGMLDRVDSVMFTAPMVYTFIITLGIQIMR